MFARLLVPLDGTPEAEGALPLAHALAAATGARVTLLRVIPAGHCADDPRFVRARGELAEIATRLAGAEWHVETAVVRALHGGDVAEDILREIQLRGSDLVVMTTHGRSGLALMAHGSVAEALLARSPAPVLLQRTWNGERPVRLAPILAPVDGTPAGGAALGAAATLARATGAEIFLLRAVVPEVRGGEDAIRGTYAGRPVELHYDRQALADAQRYVDRLAERLRARGIAAQGRALFGPVTELILEMAEQIDSGLIAMSTRAITGPARAVLGSVADAVIRQSGRPVLLVRRDVPGSDAGMGDDTEQRATR